MPHDFSHLGKYDPRGRKAWWTVPIEGSPELHVCHAGSTNKPYANAVAKMNAKTGTARRMARGQFNADSLEESLHTDRVLFPKHVITDWKGVQSSDGELVPFTPEVCREFLDALPSWIMQELSQFAAVASNFLPDDMPDEDEVADQAGN